jgi:pimeloyl-ACP methyl ester carboxylesterase
MTMKLATIDLGGPVHYADFGGSGPPMVLVHGLGGSLTNWLAVAEALTSRFHVFAPDLIGFGRTPLAGRGPGIAEQSAMIARFIDHVGGGPAVVVGNSMGGLVAVQLAADHPELVARIILVNAALPRELGTRLDRTVVALFALYMAPLVGEAFLRRRTARIGPEGVLRETMLLCGVDVNELPPEVYAAQLEVARARLAMPWAHQSFLLAARSVVMTAGRRGRMHAMIRRIKAPGLLIHGSRDRLVPVSVGEDVKRLRPDWRLTVLDDVGHVPQLQVPERWLAAVTSWLDEVAA